jgi:hypothetical protein
MGLEEEEEEGGDGEFVCLTCPAATQASDQLDFGALTAWQDSLKFAPAA